VIGNCVATLVVAIWERELDTASLRARLAGSVALPLSEPVAEPLAATASRV